MLGKTRSSKQDYDIAQQKVREYRARNAKGEASLSDTTRQFSGLLALDADFAKKDFDNELLQHRDVDIRLKPLFKFTLAAGRDNAAYALRNRYENLLVDRFIEESPVPIRIANLDTLTSVAFRNFDVALLGDTNTGAGQSNLTPAEQFFLRGLYNLQLKLYSAALNNFDQAVEAAEDGRYQDYYKAFYHLNRGVLRAEMIDFISSIENNVQTLTLDDQGTTRARVRDRVTKTYDYSEAIDSYSRAIELYPFMGDAYYNRGLVLIYLKDKEKGCIDLSRSGELGVADAYGVISKYCEEKEK